jgi:hypothetical protein
MTAMVATVIGAMPTGSRECAPDDRLSRHDGKLRVERGGPEHAAELPNCFEY